MNIFYIFLVLACLLKAFIPQLHTRRRTRQPLYLVPSYLMQKHKEPPLASPLVKKMMKKRQKFIKRLEKIETEAQRKLDAAEADREKIRISVRHDHKALDKEKEAAIEKTRLRYEQERQKYLKITQAMLQKNIAEISESINEKKEELAEKKHQKELALIQKAQEDSLRKVNVAESELFERYIAGESIEAADAALEKRLIQEKRLEAWRDKRRKELGKAIDYLSEVLQADEELYHALQDKRKALETTITSTKKFNDKHYKNVITELKPLTLTLSAQKKADGLLEEVLKEMDIPKATKKKIRTLVLYKLPPLIRPLIKTDHDISNKRIRQILTEAISEAKETPLKLEENPKLLNTYLETLKEEFEKVKTAHVAAEIARKRDTRETQEIMETIKEAALETEIELKEQTAQTHRELELAQATHIADKIMIHREKEHAQHAVETAKAAQVAGTITVHKEAERTQHAVETAKTAQVTSEIMSASTEQERTRLLETHDKLVQRTTQLKKGQIELEISNQRAQDELEQLAELQEEKLRKLKEQTQQAMRQLKEQQEQQRLQYEVKNKTLQEEKEEIRKQHVDLLEKWNSVAQLKSSVEKLTQRMQQTIDETVKRRLNEELQDVRQLIDEKDKKASIEKEVLEEKQKRLAKKQTEVKIIGNTLKSISAQAQEKLESAKRRTIEYEIEKLRVADRVARRQA